MQAKWDSGHVQLPAYRAAGQSGTKETGQEMPKDPDGPMLKSAGKARKEY